jgi:hypothetical protein
LTWPAPSFLDRRVIYAVSSASMFLNFLLQTAEMQPYYSVLTFILFLHI